MLMKRVLKQQFNELLRLQKRHEHTQEQADELFQRQALADRTTSTSAIEVCARVRAFVACVCVRGACVRVRSALVRACVHMWVEELCCDMQVANREVLLNCMPFA